MIRKPKYNVAVVGVGAVGEEMLRVLKQRHFPLGELRVFARSERDIKVDNDSYHVLGISPEGFEGIDFALFAGTEGEKGAAVTFAPEAVKHGAVVIDNGADFRMDKDVPLVVPEVNAKDAKKHKGIIANPNCSTIQMAVALNPIHKLSKIKRIIVSTYQAVSGAGRSAIRQLESESEKICGVQTNAPAEKVFAYNIAHNLIPQIGAFADAGYTSEEWKMVRETHKIFHTDKIKISATTVRVPVKTGHSESIYIETQKSLDIDAVKAALSKSGSIIVKDDIANSIYPLPADCEGKDEVFVGRIRKDPFVDKGLWLWVVADNLRKGAATNAIQIAEYLIS
ncbi:MAG: aspartate-semialdehyde dehydrogenase [Candidatus Omnitrophica bacterium CG11_big_fil_rev_8_21_14_0_20_42_13]|uniref:Aspartate-semialdehyde dehydrogenase n=1 Tax=Candidatus Ghiorseimicrobium undicola TaxID=1974746 RepID=A0A2H0LW38_9BACT|nr:MAG: aspartate-semialdehyde dehydrogenase [Candidatus Omnitrophica bacterium CG11_big_fil_rev_8_21_14_0_20_42_13]